jgi:hypothetical protein
MEDKKDQQVTVKTFNKTTFKQHIIVFSGNVIKNGEPLMWIEGCTAEHNYFQ